MEDLDLEVAGNIIHAFSYFDNEDVHMSSDTVPGSVQYIKTSMCGAICCPKVTTRDTNVQKMICIMS